MYQQSKSLHLTSTVSSLCNNLSVLETRDQTIVATVHKSSVSLFMITRDEKQCNQRHVICKDPSSNSAVLTITSVALVECCKRYVLVIASSRGVHMYEADGSSMLYWFALRDSSSGDAGDESRATYAKGIASPGANIVCVGTYNGDILLFNIPSSGNHVSMIGKCDGHSEAVSELAAGNCGGHDVLVSGDDEGGIQTWVLHGDRLQAKFRVQGGRSGVSGGWPVNSLAVWCEASCAIAAYGSGMVRIFDVFSGDMLAEIAAHGRLISSIDFASRPSLLLTVSEDTTWRLFRLTASDNGAQTDVKVAQVQMEVVNDRMLQGARFTDSRGRCFFLSSFDSDELCCYVSRE